MRGALVRQHDAQGAAVLEGHALGQLAGRAQVIEMMSDQASVPADLILPALLAVDLLDHGQWDHDLVVLEGEDRIGVVEQHVRVEDVNLLQIWSLKLAPVSASVPSCIRPGIPTVAAPRSLSSGNRRSADGSSGCHLDSARATGMVHRRSLKRPRAAETSAAG